MPEGCSSSSILRVTMSIIWLKSTMMKTIIQNQSKKESLATYAVYSDYVKKNGHLWKEKKKYTKPQYRVEKAS